MTVVADRRTTPVRIDPKLCVVDTLAASAEPRSLVAFLAVAPGENQTAARRRSPHTIVMRLDRTRFARARFIAVNGTYRNREMEATMRKSVLLILILTGLILAWRTGRLSALEERARRLSDLPVNMLLAATSGFEREGRDPAKVR